MKKKEAITSMDVIQYLSSPVASVSSDTNFALTPINKRLDNEIKVNVALREFHKTVENLMKVVHGFPVLSPTFLETGKATGLDESERFYASKLWKGRFNSVEENSEIFKGRFISMIISSIDDRISEILASEMSYRSEKSTAKGELNLIFQISSCITNFSTKFMKGEDCEDELRKLFELDIMGTSREQKAKKKVVNVVLKELDHLEEMVDTGFFAGAKVPDDAFIQNICMLGYIVTTGCGDVKNKLMVPEGTRFKDRDAIKTILEVLGSCILDKKNYGNEQTMYQCYVGSLPILAYDFSDVNYNPYLREGCRALSYVGFLSGNKKIKKIIQKIV
jgi:hypothetical protein